MPAFFLGRDELAGDEAQQPDPAGQLMSERATLGGVGSLAQPDGEQHINMQEHGMEKRQQHGNGRRSRALTGKEK